MLFGRFRAETDGTSVMPVKSEYPVANAASVRYTGQGMISEERKGKNMYCKKCGNELKETARFCGVCGEPVSADGDGCPAEKTGRPLKRKTNPLAVVLGVLAACALVVGIACGLYLAMRNAADTTSEEQEALEQAQQSLEEEDYEFAAILFEGIMESDPAQTEAYIGLADARIGMEDLAGALEVLEAAPEEVRQDERVEEKIEEIRAGETKKPEQREPDAADTPDDEPEPEATPEATPETTPEETAEVVDRELVTDAYSTQLSVSVQMYDEETGGTRDEDMICDFRIPQILLEGEDVEQINDEIYDTVYPVVEMVEQDIQDYGFPYTSQGASYRWSVSGDVLSLVVWTEASPEYGGISEHMVYNLSVSGGERLGDAELLEATGWAEEAYRNALTDALTEKFVSLNQSAVEQLGMEHDFIRQQLDLTLADDNMDAAMPYLDEDGQLCVIVCCYTMTGSGESMVELCLGNGDAE